jgi:hypothetical protein
LQQRRIRASKIILAALAIVLASITLVAVAIYIYYSAQVQVGVETPKVTWTSGSDMTAITGTNKTSCQITLGNLEPNATTVYTSALKFTIGSTSSGSGGMALQILTVTDSDGIVWGIKLYVFTQGASSTSLTLVDGGNATILNTDGGSAIATVGYRQSGASSGYGSATYPTESSGFTGNAGTTYVIAIEVMGKDGISTASTASIQLKLVWS